MATPAAALDYRTIEVHPIAPAIGAEITGVDLSRDLDDEVVAEIRRAWLTYLVVFFRDQTLDPDRFVRLARRFGEIGFYPFVAGMEGHPEIVEVIKREDETVNFGGLWHSDTTYLEQPPTGSLLYAKEVPPVGGDTLFANGYLAWETLSPGMRRMLEGLRAVSSAEKPDAALTRVARKAERPRDPGAIATTAEHPVARTHPETGRRSLYVNVGHTVRFVDWTDAESRPLLEFLFRHQIREEFTCRFRWAVGSVAFWDNRCALHNALNDYHGHRRVMHRITLAGETPR